MADYKGFYYGGDDDQNFYEGGAHFKYYQLYKALENLYKEQQTKIRNEELLAKRQLSYIFCLYLVFFSFVFTFFLK